jgi:hypothetical protein
VHCHDFAIIYRHRALFSGRAPPSIRRLLLMRLRKESAMRNTPRTTTLALDHRVWRDLTLLAVRGLGVGIAASLILALAVFAVA